MRVKIYYLSSMKNFILMIIAIILVPIFGILGFVYSMFVSKSRRKYFRNIAESLDQFGGVLAQDLFNQWMLRGDYYPFGNIDETPSSVIGKNKAMGTLTRAGKWLDKVLNRFDKNHSEDAIEVDP
jgi:8-oxo-dGTP diphosphatase